MALLTSIRLEDTDAHGDYHCLKVCGPQGIYEFAPTGWASSLKSKRTFGLFLTRPGGVREPIGRTDVTGGAVFWRWMRHCPPEYRVKVPYSRSVDLRDL